MFESMEIQSHKGVYRVFFDSNLLDNMAPIASGDCHFLVDSNVARLYQRELEPILQSGRTILIDAVEPSKSLHNIIPVFERLVAARARRDHILVAIGGGIIQDITCFIASTLLRGVRWRFVPTTLLSQADSCIGSKSSINLGDTKNILGTFNPPDEIYITPRFLGTLDEREIRSGIGEILKVHAIDSPASFDRVAQVYPHMLEDQAVLLTYIRSALIIKQRFIEVDEFDRGVRNIFNYGHSFGHAIEAATHFDIPHGIAVTMGMDMANSIAVRRGLLPLSEFARMHPVLLRNYLPFAKTNIPLDELLAALQKDKKNTSTELGLVFPIGEAVQIKRINLVADAMFTEDCKAFLDHTRYE